MKLLRTIYSFILMSTFLVGCNIDDDLADCPAPPADGEVILRFDYPYNGSKATFLNRISRVNVGIYRMDGTLVESRQIDKDSLVVDSITDPFGDVTYYPGMKTRLPMGNYRATFWGNAYDKTKIDWEVREVYNSHLFDEQVRIASDDSLTYANVQIEVVADTNRALVHFEPAHINLEVAVIDDAGVFPEMSSVTRTDEIPFVSINHLPGEVYDFDMKDIDTAERNFYPTWEPQIEPQARARRIFVSRTSVHRMDNDNPVVINLVDNTKQDHILATTVLKDYINDHPDFRIESQKEITIYVTYQLKKEGQDVVVTVSPLPWKELVVTPNT
ncbi:MAG: FimB/Mfa2 family fimbrial subunit [Mediterranea sp.]|jgi:hypothetical protein|nr:FimB/Mfa2 family fimbrial subunit [Mediterranea sp.]